MRGVKKLRVEVFTDFAKVMQRARPRRASRINGNVRSGGEASVFDKDYGSFEET